MFLCHTKVLNKLLSITFMRVSESEMGSLEMLMVGVKGGDVGVAVSRLSLIDRSCSQTELFVGIETSL